jgi:ATP-binding cassette subfamily F protein 3
MILACSKITKSFGTDTILDGVSFQINKNEKVALIGVNGAGKSTLFKIIAGKLEADSGKVIIHNQSNLAYLAQNSVLDSDNSLYEEMLTAKQMIIDLEQTLADLEKEITNAHNNPSKLESLNKRYADLRHEYELLDGYSYKSKVIGVLKGLGFLEDDFNRKIIELSGGQKTRLALAKKLLSEPDILLLDEPTNHLDITATAWLENYLSAYNGTLVIISHDRYFLDKIVSSVIELEQSQSTLYKGNYTHYIQNKNINREIDMKHYESQQKEIKKQEEVITKLRSFNREKSIKRAESREKALDKVERLDKPIALKDAMRINLEPKVVSGNDVLNVRDLSMAYTPDHVLFEGINFEVFKGEKIALLGDNGTGKTTIFKLILNQLNPINGTITLGSRVYPGYYDQEHTSLNPNNNLIEEISDKYPKMNEGEIRNVLGSFLFSNDDVFKKISTLSGGEKGRLSLAILMLSKANFILLDEPTNHLDIVSKEILENALVNYTGTILFISHDRYFINKVASRVLDLTQNQVFNYGGNYSYYLEKKQERMDNILSSNNTSTQTDTVKPHKNKWEEKKAEEAKKRKHVKEIEKTEARIHEVETLIEEKDTLLLQEDVFSDYVKANEIHLEKTALEEELEGLYEKWEALTE